MRLRTCTRPLRHMVDYEDTGLFSTPPPAVSTVSAQLSLSHTYTAFQPIMVIMMKLSDRDVCN